MITVQAVVDVSDLDELIEQMSPSELTDLLAKAFTQSLQPAVEGARALAPRRTGKLARSIRVRIRKRAGLDVSIVGGPYAHLVEYGHRIVRGGHAPRVGRSLRAVGGVLTGPRGGRYTGQVDGFVAAHPFARPAFEAAAPEVERDVAASIEADLAKTQSGL